MNKKPFEQEHENMKVMLQRVSEVYPDNIAFVVKKHEKKKAIYENHTYNMLFEDTKALGTVLLSKGYGDGRFAIMGENSYPWIMTFFSVVNGVGVAIPIDRAMQIDEVESCLNRSKANVYFFDKKALPIAEQVCNRDNTEVKMFVGLDFKPEFGFSLEELQKEGETLIGKGDKSYDEREIDNDKMSVMVFTSGTTAKS